MNKLKTKQTKTEPTGFRNAAKRVKIKIYLHIPLMILIYAGGATAVYLIPIEFVGWTVFGVAILGIFTVFISFGRHLNKIKKQKENQK